MKRLAQSASKDALLPVQAFTQNTASQNSDAG
jgi:hypothetical protein